MNQPYQHVLVAIDPLGAGYSSSSHFPAGLEGSTWLLVSGWSIEGNLATGSLPHYEDEQGLDKVSCVYS